HCIHRTHFAYDGIHIDHGIEERDAGTAADRGAKTGEPDPRPKEYPQAAPDFASEEANPSEEDHGIEEQTQEQPLIEEPEDQEPDPQPEEYPQAAPDFASEEANPSEEGMEFLFCACVRRGTCYHQE
ncbi:hypothetical protein U9M48_002551, partial [Paspalum notatum var. saurae]